MYETFYNLRAKPFQLNPDPRFYFNSKGHKRAMSYLEYGLSQGEGFIVITGEVGAGKTTLVSHLIKRLAAANIIHAQLVSTQLGADDTLRMIAAAFGVAHDDASKAVLLKKLETFLLTCHRQKKRALLIVDEAQNLTKQAVEELRMLSNFQADNTPLLQSFLLGQPEFRDTIQSAEMQQLRQRVIASYHLGPLDAGETRAYIEHRLKTVGWMDSPHFTDDAFAAIHAFTEGIPRRINTLCDRLMLFGYLEEKSNLDQAIVQEVTNDLLSEVAGNSNSTTQRRDTDSISGQSDSGLEGRLATIEDSLGRILRVLRRVLAAMAKLEKLK